jgi:hypothetical protein
MQINERRKNYTTAAIVGFSVTVYHNAQHGT